MRRTILLASGLLIASALAVHADGTWYADQMVEFLPAPGQFVGESVADTAHHLYGVGQSGDLVSLGGFGGYITLRLDTPAVNHPNNPYGIDFQIKGNSFGANIMGVWTEPGAVQVAKSLNGPWYELAGSDYYLNSTLRNVSITYYNPYYDGRKTIPWVIRDAQGNVVKSGAMITNQFHNHSYYPYDFGFNCGADSVTYSGNLIKGCIDLSTPSYVENYRPQLFGYADNRGFGTMNIASPANPYSHDQKIADGFDLAWAVDANGQPANIDTVRYVRIYTALNQDGGWLGELSSEILSVGVTQPSGTSYANEEYYVNYIGVNRLKAVVGESVQYEGILFKNGRPCTDGTPHWWLSDNSLGSITNNGLFTPTNEGQGFIYFQRNTSVPYDSVKVTVVSLTGVVLEMEGNTSAATQESCLVGEKIFITAQSTDNIVTFINNSTANRYIYDTYTWTLSNPSVGTIEEGLFTGVAAGSTTLTVTSQTDPTLSASMTITVHPLALLPVANPYYLASSQVANNATLAMRLSSLFSVAGTTGYQVVLDSCRVLDTDTADLHISPATDNKGIELSVDTMGTFRAVFGVHLAKYPNITCHDTITFVYQPEHYAVNSGTVKISGTALKYGNNTICTLTHGENILHKDVSVYNTNANSLSNVKSGYVYAATKNSTHITKVNVTTGQIVAEVDADIIILKIASLGNYFMAVNGNTVQLFHRSDLSKVAIINTQGQRIDLMTLNVVSGTGSSAQYFTIDYAKEATQVKYGKITANSNPVIKNLVEDIANIDVYEYNTSSDSRTIETSEMINDMDNTSFTSHRIFLYNYMDIKDYVTLSDGSYNSASSTYTFTFPDTLSHDTVIPIVLEVYDELGANSIQQVYNLRVFPRIYSLYVRTPIGDITMGTNASRTISVADLFTAIQQPDDPTGLSYTTSLVGSSSSVVSASLSGSTLTLGTGNATGTATITMRYTAQYVGSTTITRRLDYSFNVAVTNRALAPQNTTGLNSISENGKVFASGNQLFVDGFNGRQMAVYNVLGMQVYNGIAQNIVIPQSGTYVILIDDYVNKIIIK
ncbi:MAG: hypothetical protein IJV81_00845 [Paludibacteraceae bacterium]|nr:hypothetical protein [Paludibacteraceae bacterium]